MVYLVFPPKIDGTKLEVANHKRFGSSFLDNVIACLSTANCEAAERRPLRTPN